MVQPEGQTENAISENDRSVSPATSAESKNSTDLLSASNAASEDQSVSPVLLRKPSGAELVEQNQETNGDAAAVIKPMKMSEEEVIAEIGKNLLIILFIKISFCIFWERPGLFCFFRYGPDLVWGVGILCQVLLNFLI